MPLFLKNLLLIHLIKANCFIKRFLPVLIDILKQVIQTLTCKIFSVKSKRSFTDFSHVTIFCQQVIQTLTYRIFSVKSKRLFPDFSHLTIFCRQNALVLNA